MQANELKAKELKAKLQMLNEEAFALRFTDFQRSLHLAETALALIGN